MSAITSDRPHHRTGGPVNVARSERWVSFVAGGMLTLLGIQMRSIRGGLLALTGASLIHRGVTGHCYTYDALGVDTAAGEPPLPNERTDAVDEASIDSFPASDSPIWTPTTGSGAPRRR